MNPLLAGAAAAAEPATATKTAAEAAQAEGSHGISQALHTASGYS